MNKIFLVKNKVTWSDHISLNPSCKPICAIAPLTISHTFGTLLANPHRFINPFQIIPITTKTAERLLSWQSAWRVDRQCWPPSANLDCRYQDGGSIPHSCKNKLSYFNALYHTLLRYKLCNCSDVRRPTEIADLEAWFDQSAERRSYQIAKSFDSKLITLLDDFVRDISRQHH